MSGRARARLAALVVVAAGVAIAVFAAAGRSGGAPRLTGASWEGGGGNSVALRFDARPVAELSHVSVTDPSGVPLGVGEPVAGNPDTLVVPVLSASGGDVTVAYHAVFGDGRELAGSTALGAAPPGDSAAAGHQHEIDPIGASLLVIDGIALLVTVIALRRSSSAARRRRAG